MSQTKPLATAVLDVIVTNFVAPLKKFSAHDITVLLRTHVNRGDYTIEEFDGVPSQFTQEIQHSVVRNAVQDLFNNGTLTRNFNGTYFEYVVSSLNGGQPATQYVLSPEGQKVLDTINQYLKDLGRDDNAKVDSKLEDHDFDEIDIVELEMILEQVFQSELKGGSIELPVTITPSSVVKDVIEAVKKLVIAAGSTPATPPAAQPPPIVDPVVEKVKVYINGKLAKNELPTLKHIQSATKAGKTVSEIRNIVEQLGFKVHQDRFAAFNQWQVSK